MANKKHVDIVLVVSIHCLAIVLAFIGGAELFELHFVWGLTLMGGALLCAYGMAHRSVVLEEEIDEARRTLKVERIAHGVYVSELIGKNFEQTREIAALESTRAEVAELVDMFTVTPVVKGRVQTMLESAPPPKPSVPPRRSSIDWGASRSNIPSVKPPVLNESSVTWTETQSTQVP
ncbi:MAG TPA: hypothetical protein VFT22_11000 [Kofleriaceae bacterium]|nr:hypothetical protein [Kofleriaceae bacterium]